MEFRTVVGINPPPWKVQPRERMFFVGSCFADSMGRRFKEEGFPVTVNPFGVMYNPASVLHTVQRMDFSLFGMVVLTLGTNHVYIEKETGKIVDNCQKRPQYLFEERELSVEECANYLQKSITHALSHNPQTKILLTVSPIRYRKYGFHESQLSKATLLLAVEKLVRALETTAFPPVYFPAYEIVNDELRDYRFYQADMLHPSAQAVEYIWQRLMETCFSEAARQYVEEWRPVKQALAHKPFNPDSPEYQQFKEQAAQRLAAFRKKWGVEEIDM